MFFKKINKDKKEKKIKNNFFNNLNLGIKLSLGFIILILLAGIMGGTSYLGINNIIDRVDKGYSADNIVKIVLETKKAETGYVNNSNQDDAEIVDRKINQIIDKAWILKQSFKSESNKKLMDRIVNNAEDYKASFSNVTQIVENQKQLERVMHLEGEKLVEAAKSIQTVQKAQYENLIQKQNYSKDELEKILVITDKSNSIIVSVKDANITFNNYVKTGQKDYIVSLKKHLSYIKTIASDSDMTVFFTSKRMIEGADKYSEAFDKYIEASKNEEKAEKKLLALSDAMQEITMTAKENQQIQKDALVESTFSLLLIILAICIIAGIFVSIIVTRSITKPIKLTVNMIKDMSKGKLNKRLNISTKDEIGVMAKTMDDFADTLHNDIAGSLNEIAAGNIDVHIEPKSENDELAVNMNKLVTSLKFIISLTQDITSDAIKGRLDLRSDLDNVEGGFKTIVDSINNLMDTMVGHLDSVTIPIMIIDKEYNIQYMNKQGLALTGSTLEATIGTKCYESIRSNDCNSEKCAICKAMKTGEVVISETDAHPAGQNLNILYSGVPLTDRDNNIIGGLEIITDQTAIKKAQRVAEKRMKYQEKEVKDLVSNLERLAQGDLDLELSPSETDDDTRYIGENFNNIKNNLSISVNSIKDYVTEISHVLTQMANSNLDIEIENDYKGDFEPIKNALNLIIETFNEVLSEINNAAEQVATGAVQVSDASQELSQGASEQASSVGELTSTMSQISIQTKQNAENADNANEIATLASIDAQQGNKYMEEMLQSMEEIEQASKDISKIIKVIDEIAFQTNILALNAAVEAARAGQHGKGFAVVAEEVRSLAVRSANAAKETTELIDSSITKVGTGTQVAQQTAQALNKIVDEITKASELVGQIAEASNEQAAGITQINGGIDQISKVVQKNSATSEQSAAASEELSGQAQHLKDSVHKFKIKSDIKEKHQIKGLENFNPNKEDEKRKIMDINNTLKLCDNEFGKY